MLNIYDTVKLDCLNPGDLVITAIHSGILEYCTDYVANGTPFLVISSEQYEYDPFKLRVVFFDVNKNSEYVVLAYENDSLRRCKKI